MLGKGTPYVMSTQQKINTKSSTKAKLVGVDDGIGQIMSTGYFLQKQGFDIKENIILHDNKSAILLEENGTALRSKRTRHLNIRYFFY